MFEDNRFKNRANIFLFLCQNHHFEINAWNIMNGVYDKYKGDTFLSIHLGLI